MRPLLLMRRTIEIETDREDKRENEAGRKSDAGNAAEGKVKVKDEKVRWEDSFSKLANGLGTEKR